MAHGTDDGKSITRIWHVQVRKQYIEMFDRNKPERLVDGGGSYNFESSVFQASTIHFANIVIVVHQQNSLLRHTNFSRGQGWQRGDQHDRTVLNTIRFCRVRVILKREPY